MKVVPLSDLLTEAQPGFACGKEDPEGVFQFRMHNVSKTSSLNLDKRRYVPWAAHRNIERFLVEAGDVLFNATNSPEAVGKSVLVRDLPEPAVFSNHFVRLRTTDRLDQQYLWRWLQFEFMRGTFQGLTKQWVNQATVSRSDLLAMRIPTPMIDEQRRIAAILDQADAIRTKRRQVLAHLDALPQAIFHEMFGGLGATTTVDEVAAPHQGSIRTGPFGSQLLHEEFVDDGVAVLGLDNVVGNEFRWAERRFITEDKYRQLQRYTVNPGDVLISIMGTTGRCVVVPDDIPRAINTKHICAISVDPQQVDPEFLRAAFLWHTASRKHLLRQTKGSIMSGLNMGIIKAMPVPVPALAQQRAFREEVASVKIQRTSIAAASTKDDELFASLQARAFRGEL